MLKRNLLTSLLLYESVRTTKKRAEAVAPLVDRLMSIAKRSAPQNAIRAINRVVTDKNASRKIMEVYLKRFASIPSALTRIVPVGVRLGDGAHIVDLVLVEGVGVKAETGEGERKAKKAKKPEGAKRSLLASLSLKS
jgi:large subunit ribosomal protein L17